MTVTTLTVCIACLRVGDLDKDGLCASCSPDDEDFRKVLLALLTEPVA